MRHIITPTSNTPSQFDLPPVSRHSACLGDDPRAPPTPPIPSRHDMQPTRDSFTECPNFTHSRVPGKSLCSLHTPPGPGRRYENTLQSIKKPTHHNFSPPVDGLLHADERGRSEAGFGRRLCVELTPDHVFASIWPWLHNIAASDGEGDFDIAQMKILILETTEAEFRYWALNEGF
jgi:hypothetical protein